ncbi:MAG: anti-sigma factor [Balneolaceae bacterium]|nr:anti-sigma factor [Balneolaceae bacterium]
MADDNTQQTRFEELCSAYVLNALEPQERSEFEQMLEDADEEQEQLYRTMRSTAGNLAFTTDREDPPAEVKARLMDVINEEIAEHREQPQEEPGTGGPGYDTKTFAIAASFALLLVTLSLVFYAFNLSSKLQQRSEQLEQRDQIITELKQEIDRKSELLEILESREVDMVLMRGMEANPRGYGKIIWDAGQQRALLQVSNLPPVPAGKEYQLWIIKNNEPVSAGLFAVNDPRRDAFFKIEQMDSADTQSTSAFAVTLEPEGGMPKPTGDMYLMGNTEN